MPLSPFLPCFRHLAFLLFQKTIYLICAGKCILQIEIPIIIVIDFFSVEEKEREMTKAWQERGQWHCENETLEEDYDKNAYGDNHPFDVMEFRCLTYLDGSYCSLVFFAQHYTGGVSAFPDFFSVLIRIVPFSCLAYAPVFL